MSDGTLIAEIAAIAGEPARAQILCALLDGRALTASELAYAARVTPQTASAHLAKLAEVRLISCWPNGRHRYFRLASPKVAQMLESIIAVAVDGRPRFRPLSREAAALRDARFCYDHLAGRLGVGIADALVGAGRLVLEEEGGQLTDDGTRFLTEFGIDLAAPALHRRSRFCRACLDWTERRAHVGGAIGAALAERCLALGWIERARHSRAVTVTPAGRSGFAEFFGLSLDQGKAVA